MQEPQEVSFVHQEATPPPHFQEYLPELSDPIEIEPIGLDDVEPGHMPPRLVTPSWGDKSLGPQVAAWAKTNMQIDMYPWQITAINGMLEVDNDNKLLHRWGLVSTARQNGKTKGLLAPLIGWWLTYYAAQRGEPQSIMSVAHLLDIAQDVAKELFPILEENFGFQTYMSHGRMEAIHNNGSRWRVAAGNPKAGHGTSNDLIVCDEIWKLDAEVIEAGLLPTQRAKKNPFTLFVSTAGTEDSTMFVRWRERGIQQIEAGKPGRLYMAEWSPPANVESTDRRYWPMANPAMGLGNLTMQDLEDELLQPDRDNFMRMSLNLWTAAIGAWIPPGVWERLQIEDPMPAGGVLAVDTDVTDLRYVGVRVAQREDGHLQVLSEFVVEDLDEMWQECQRVMQDRSVELALTPGLATMCPLDLRRRMNMFGYKEVNKYTKIVKNLILEGRIHHSGQMSLSEQVNRAVAGRTGSGIALASQKSPGPIEQCRCMVAAAGMAAKPSSNVRKPMIGMSR